jgi:hypothetical protein
MQMQLVMSLETPLVTPEALTQAEPVAEPEPLPLPAPATATDYLPPADVAPKARGGLVGLIKQLLGATKK